MACEYCKDHVFALPIYDTSHQMPHLVITTGKEIAFYPFDEKGWKHHIHYEANFCFHCGSKLGDSDD